MISSKFTLDRRSLHNRNNKMEEIYKKVIKIRAFEETILGLFGQNKLSGTTHTYIGQEATAVAIMNHVTDNDVIFSNHRCHGHYLAYGGPERKLLAEIMSKESGLCKGRGGSQHIKYKNLFTNGIQGGIVPNALGVAFAKKLDSKQDNTFVFLGDGTLGQGVVYESVNIAVAYQISMIFVVEDNQYAMSTRRTDVISGDIASRFTGFGLKTFEITSTDVDELNQFFEMVIDYTNNKREPVCAIVHNYRLGAHSKGDDTRDPVEIAENKLNDPINLIAKKIGDDDVRFCYDEYKKSFALLAEELEKEDSITISEPECRRVLTNKSFLYDGNNRCVELLQNVFGENLKKNKNIVMYGEDICDPYGGAYKATKGLSTIFSEQIYNMPISEACMTGMAVGMGMAGKIPVVEMMFGDFITLGFDQLLNHASKYAWVYEDGVKVPMIIRAPMGGKRGYGPTHSQSIEKFLIGIPMIKVLALSVVHNPKVIYNTLFSSIEETTVVIENKKLYAERIAAIVDNQYGEFEVIEENNYGYSTLKFTLDSNNRPDYVLVTYGGMVKDCLEAAEILMMEEEIQADVIVLSQLSPLPMGDLERLIDHSSRIAFIEEGSKCAGIGAEFIARFAENAIGKDYIRIGAFDCPIPNGIILENQVVPNKKTIVEEIRRKCL